MTITMIIQIASLVSPKQADKLNSLRTNVQGFVEAEKYWLIMNDQNVVNQNERSDVKYLPELRGKMNVRITYFTSTTNGSKEYAECCRREQLI